MHISNDVHSTLCFRIYICMYSKSRAWITLSRPFYIFCLFVAFILHALCKIKESVDKKRTHFIWFAQPYPVLIYKWMNTLEYTIKARRKKPYISDVCCCCHELVYIIHIGYFMFMYYIRYGWYNSEKCVLYCIYYSFSHTHTTAAHIIVVSNFCCWFVSFILSRLWFVLFGGNCIAPKIWIINESNCVWAIDGSYMVPTKDEWDWTMMLKNDKWYIRNTFIHTYIYDNT